MSNVVPLPMLAAFLKIERTLQNLTATERLSVLAHAAASELAGMSDATVIRFADDLKSLTRAAAVGGAQPQSQSE